MGFDTHFLLRALGFHINEIAYLVEPTFIMRLSIICYQVFVGARLHVTGGALRGGRGVEGEAAIAGKLLANANYELVNSAFNSLL